jgi:hypothetical protein
MLVTIFLWDYTINLYDMIKKIYNEDIIIISKFQSAVKTFFNSIKSILYELQFGPTSTKNLVLRNEVFSFVSAGHNII